MKLFVDKMPGNQLKKDLGIILLRKKPFQNFKNVVETSVCRASWFAFKQSELENIVREQLKSE